MGLGRSLGSGTRTNYGSRMETRQAAALCGRNTALRDTFSDSWAAKNAFLDAYEARAPRKPRTPNRLTAGLIPGIRVARPGPCGRSQTVRWHLLCPGGSLRPLRSPEQRAARPGVGSSPQPEESRAWSLWQLRGQRLREAGGPAKAGSCGHHRLCPGLAVPCTKLPLSMHSAGPGLRRKVPKIPIVSSLLLALYLSSSSSFSHHDPILI